MREMEASEIADQFLDGLDYPIARVEILRAAREADLATTVQESLKALPDGDYEDREAVTRALNATP